MIIIALITIFLVLYFFNKLCLWLERKGWIYYRHKKPQGGIMGNALLELQAFLNPSARYAVEVKQNKISQQRETKDGVDDKAEN